MDLTSINSKFIYAKETPGKAQPHHFFLNKLCIQKGEKNISSVCIIFYGHTNVIKEIEMCITIH